MSTPAGDRPLGVLTTSYPTDPHGSAGSFVRGFCAACGAAGHEVEVLCPEPAAPGSLPVDAGVRVHPLAYFRPRRAQFLSAAPGAPEALQAHPALWASAAAYAARLSLATLARRKRYRALVSHWLVPCALSGALASTIPHLAIAHGSDVHLLERMSVGSGIARFLVRQGLYFAFVSGQLRHRFAALLTPALREELHRRAVVQPMGVHTAELSSRDRERARSRLGLRGPVALWLGRFTPLKRPTLALALAESMPELTVLMAGAGPEESALRQRARGLGERVRFCGWVDGVRRQELLAAADVLVVTSTVLADGRSEGAPVVALEGLAAGLPVVATAVGGLGELSDLDAPLALVANGDLPGLIRCCRILLAAGRPSERRRARLARTLDWHTVLPRLLSPLGL